MKFNLSLGKILLGFAGMSLAVCAYKFYSAKDNEEDTSHEDSCDDYCTEDNVNLSESTSNSKSLISSVVNANEEFKESKTSSEKAVSQNKKAEHLDQPEVNHSESSVNSKNTLNDECCSDVSVIDSSETDDSYTPNYEILNLIESDEFKKVEIEKHLLNIIEKQKLG